MNFVDVVMWVFFKSKDKSLEMSLDVAQEDIKQDKNKGVTYESIKI